MSIGTPGIYEFLKIQSVNTFTKNIIFTRDTRNSYDVAGLVQLISVPSYNSARVNSELTCKPWDSLTTKTGGVLALIVGGTLTLDAGINVAGMGLKGGTPYQGDGICFNTNVSAYDKYAYPDSYTNSGWKGESIASWAWISASEKPSLLPNYAKGKGSNFIGGGGGNGRYSGGGGGSGIGNGGKGGRENSGCGPPGDGGLGGKQVLFTTLEGNIIMGGGGGSSTSAAGSTASAGGKGGGIIIIICDTLKSNGINTITANGETASSPSGSSSGAGGGGGGGSVALYQQSFSLKTASSELKIYVHGGNGGNNSTNNGEGGGGGGGLILTNLSTFPSRVDTSTAGGLRGTRGGLQRYSTNGDYGKVITNFIPLLNGFLFNTIRSSVTNNHVDSVCSNMRPPKIVGTMPVGGTSPYTYIWEKSYESTFTSPIVLSNNIADPWNYTPSVADAVTPTDTVWFRRTVIDDGAPQITDISKAVKIIVHPGIINNKVGNPDTICFNGDPPLISQLMPDLIVPSTKYFYYNWQDSSSSATWGTTKGTEKDYDPPAGLGITTWYRRTVVSGSCIDSSTVVRINVLPVITGNSILTPVSLEQDICNGTLFNNLTATTPLTTPALGGGDNTYRFKWISDINGAGWTTAPGVSNLSGYNPVELAQKVPLNEYYLRRIVYSGSNNVCFDTTSVVHLRDFPVITNNVINTVTTNQPICSGSAPVKITGVQPSNGNGVFTYTWQDSTNSSTQWQNIAGYVNVTTLEYQPPVLTQTTSYRRSAYSSECMDISNSIKIIVHQSVSNNNISLLAGGAVDTTICYGQTPHRFIGTAASGGIGIYNYQWLDSTASRSLTPVTGATQVNFPNPTSLNETTYYKRRVTSGACIQKSSATITVNVLLPISNNVLEAEQAAVCENTAPDPITGTTLSGGSGSYIYLWEESTDGGSIWTPATGTNTQSSYQPPVLSDPVKYRRKVTSGPSDCCSSTSAEVDISINPAPQGPVNAGQDASVYSLEKSYTMTADPPVVSGETGSWTVLDPGAATIVDDSDSKTDVRNLSTGKNIFLWSITNGLCSIEDSVSIELLEDFIPQGFSPNGDEWNNKFIIEGLNLSVQQIGDLTILNGAGTAVFTTTNRDGQEWVDWDGKNNKGIDLPEGTYYYLLKVTTPDKQVIKKSGFVVLKRY
jgi:hypothetical protein